MPDLSIILSWVIPAFFVLGIISAIDATLNVRNPQGATAWILSLITIPIVAFFAYWLFGRVRYQDYTEAKQRCRDLMDQDFRSRSDGVLSPFAIPLAAERGRTLAEIKGFEALADMPMCAHHDLELLIDGDQSFERLFAAIDEAESYVLVQFFIIRDDEIGRALAKRLIAARQRGARVYVLYDEIGSHSLPNSYIRALTNEGVEIAGFSGSRSLLGRFRLNFRNHRKIVVIDGHTGFMGGLNVGDEYLGRDPEFGDWRDTHLCLRGPAVLSLQRSFVEDWSFGQEELALPQLCWRPATGTGQSVVLNVASGPADAIESCGLLYAHAIESAEQRLWIASPYFVPDPRVLSALQTAALRGVDVRILLPAKSDNPIFKYVPYAYLPEIERVGAQIYLYQDDFMHQKVMLIDNSYACISTANLDNRSFRLNFETSCIVKDSAFCSNVEAMLERDFDHAKRLSRNDINKPTLRFRLAVAITRLMSPVL